MVCSMMRSEMRSWGRRPGRVVLCLRGDAVEEGGSVAMALMMMMMMMMNGDEAVTNPNPKKISGGPPGEFQTLFG